MAAGEADSGSPEPFGFGPAWSRGSGCCGKPRGCTNMSENCLCRNHPWKKRYAESIARVEAAYAAEEAQMSWNSKTEPEPGEVVVASQEATYIYAGRLDDGTRVVRDSDGLLHALVPVRRSCSPDQP
jgi:hypothetical protein